MTARPLAKAQIKGQIKGQVKGQVKGWCPSAHRPMLSGDGLVVRVRPFLAALTAEQALGLCDLARRFGHGMLDLTSRANIQIRGVAPDLHGALLEALDALGLIDADPAIEAARNILVAPDWQPGDLTHRLHQALLTALPNLPNLPQKMGFALDTGARGGLGTGSADFHFELTADGGLILRADGAEAGRPVTEETAIPALIEFAQWFVTSGGVSAGRMARHLAEAPLPPEWQTAKPRPNEAPQALGPAPEGTVLGAPFGKISATDLAHLIQDTQATGLRLMLGRRFLLQGAHTAQAEGFIIQPDDPLMTAHACPGAPHCPQASVETTALARRLAPLTPGTLHVSGCAKGCAHPKAADVTLTGRNGGFDLVTDGAPWDEARHHGVLPEHLATLSDLSELL